LQESERPHQYHQWLLTITVRFHVTEPASSDVSLDQKLSLVAGDIYFALCGDADGRKRGGWAINTNIRSITNLPRMVDANEGDCDVDVEILFRHTLGQPFE